jgi:diguanylate cyclase (GGDEF)-like protein
MEHAKRIAIVGGNKEGLSLLPILDRQKDIRVVLIVDPNKDALVFKLNELGFRLAQKYHIKISSDLHDLFTQEGLNVIVDASSDPKVRTFLAKKEFTSIEVIGELTARLLWGYREETAGTSPTKQSKLLASLNDIVEAVNLTKDKQQVSSLILQVAIESTGADNGSLMILDPEEQVLKIEVSEGIPEEAVPTVRCRLGEGIAGKVAVEGQPLLLSGKADDSTFRILREREEIKSALCVPLTVNGSTVGVLNLNNLTKIDGFTEEDLAFITKLAAFDAEILLKSQEYESLKENAETFRIWKTLNQILNAPAHLEERLLKTCRALSGHFRESVCTIYLFDRNNRELTLKASSLKDFSPFDRSKIRLREGIDGWAAKEREVIILKEYPSLDPNAKKAFMSIPLVSEGEITGVMNIQLISPQGLSDEEEMLLRDIGRHLSHTIKSAQKEDSAYVRATKIEAINEAGINILSIMDLQKLLELIPPSAAMIMDADGCILRLKESRGGVMKIRSTYSMWDDEIRDKVFELDSEIAAQVELGQKPLHIPDLGEEKGYERFGRVIKSVVAVPLTDEGQVRGTLSIYDKIPKGSFQVTSFGKEDMEIFKKFAHYVQKALTNLRESDRTRITRNYDNLTGLPNEGALNKEIENEMNRSRRYERRFILLTLCWSYRQEGRAAYDVETRNSLIGEICAILKENIREYDTLARTGPQKFVVLFPESLEKARDLTTRLTRVIRQQKKRRSSPLASVELQLKFGYAVFPDDGPELANLLHEANRLRLGAEI